MATNYESTPTTAARHVPFIKLRPFCHALFIRETETTPLGRCPALRLTCCIAGGLRVIVHANDEEQRSDPKKECLHSFPPLWTCPARTTRSLVGAQQYRWGYRKAERRGGPAIHDHLELGRKLHREIARLLATQDAIDAAARGFRSGSNVAGMAKESSKSRNVRSPHAPTSVTTQGERNLL
jgi:hypothetical protein